MKSPFAILLAVVVLIGVGIGVAAIFFLAPNGEDDQETISFASETELPTPTTRNAPVQQQTDGGATQAEVVIVSTSVTTEDRSANGLPPEVQERIESGEGVVVVTAEVDSGGGFGGARPGGGTGGPNFEALQEVMESNPEIQDLMQKAQSGEMSQADQARLRELMQEALAEAGIEAPGGRQDGGFGTPPTQGTISAISGSTVTIEHADDSGRSTDVEIIDNTNINVISQLTPADLSEGANVAGTVQRGEGGRIFIINLNVLSDQLPQSSGYGGFRGTVFGVRQTGDTATNISVIDGTITEINDQQISVETTQGTLRLTANEDSTIITTSSGTINDITQGMAAIAFGTPPNNLIVGPESLLQQGGIAGTRSLGGERRGQGQ